MNGITISPAENCLHWTCFIPPGWSGLWNLCTGCWMSILVRTFATSRIEMFRKTSIFYENLPYPLPNHLKCELPPNASFPTSCLTAFLSLTLLSLFGVKIGFREFPAGGIPTTKERIYIYPKPENRRRSRAAPPEAFSGEVFNFYVLYKIYRYTSVKSNDFAKNICKCGAIFKKRRDL